MDNNLNSESSIENKINESKNNNENGIKNKIKHELNTIIEIDSALGSDLISKKDITPAKQRFGFDCKWHGSKMVILGTIVNLDDFERPLGCLWNAFGVPSGYFGDVLKCLWALLGYLWGAFLVYLPSQTYLGMFFYSISTDLGHLLHTHS